MAAVAVETWYPTIDTTRDGACAATVVNCGRGRFAAICGPLGVLAASSHAAAIREFLDRAVRRVSAPQVEIDGPPTPEAALGSDRVWTATVPSVHVHSVVVLET